MRPGSEASQESYSTYQSGHGDILNLWRGCIFAFRDYKRRGVESLASHD